MNKNLLVFPGSTDPNIREYSKRYDLIISEAKKRGYNNIQVLNWTGQKSSKNTGTFSMQSALVDAIPIIEEYNELKNDFNIIAFSWGCSIAVRTVQYFPKLEFLNKIILWGITPYWKEYEVIEYEKHDAYKYSGCIVDDDYFKHQVPIEYLLNNYKGKIKLKIGVGCNDSDYSFLKYVESIVEKQFISFHYIKNVSHVVTSFDTEYIDFMFN